jgi:hypothetical protein
MNVSASLVFVVEVYALTLQEAISVNVLLAMSLLQIGRRVKILMNVLVQVVFVPMEFVKI